MLSWSPTYEFQFTRFYEALVDDKLNDVSSEVFLLYAYWCGFTLVSI